MVPGVAAQLFFEYGFAMPLGIFFLPLGLSIGIPFLGAHAFLVAISCSPPFARIRWTYLPVRTHNDRIHALSDSRSTVFWQCRQW